MNFGSYLDDIDITNATSAKKKTFDEMLPNSLQTCATMLKNAYSILLKTLIVLYRNTHCIQLTPESGRKLAAGSQAEPSFKDERTMSRCPGPFFFTSLLRHFRS